MSANTKVGRNEDGFAAIVIAVVLVLVLSLITVGFAQLMRGEQRSSLDTQLSSQAYYAAESGVNDAVRAINAGFGVAKDNCAPLVSSPSGLDPTNMSWKDLQDNKVGTDSNSNVEYSCLLINPTPKSLEYSSVGTEQAKVVEMTSADPANKIRSIVIRWQGEGDDSGSSFRTTPVTTLPKKGDWGTSTSMLRISLTPLIPGQLDRATLANRTFTVFLYPKSDGTPNSSTVESYVNGIGNKAGSLISAKCNKSSALGYCSVTITGLSERTYFLSMRSIYLGSKVVVRAYTDPPGVTTISNQISIKNAQTVIDSTGKAQDVLRRIQVRVPSRNGYDHPDYTVESAGSICKQLQIFPGGNIPSGSGC